MNRLLLFFFLSVFTTNLHAQAGFLFVKKGAKKKKTYTEGDRIMLQKHDGTVLNGLITHLRDDTIYLTGHPVPVSSVKAVLLPGKKNRFPADAKTLLLITGGAALTTVGLTINGRESWEKAALAAMTIGYGPLIAKYLGKGVIRMLTRKRYKIGNKMRLQVLDFHLPRQRAF